jgi:exodeoxyribonuclease-3
MDHREYDLEGRIIVLEYKEFYLVTVYVPNAGFRLQRLQYKLDFEKYFLNFVMKLKQEKNVIISGDFNVAHSELDIYEVSKQDDSGFSLEERISFQNYLDNGFIDTFRKFHPNESFFSFWANNTNLGFFIPSSSYWRRMNYFLVNNNVEFLNKIEDSTVLLNYMGTDHPPIKLTLKDKLT